MSNTNQENSVTAPHDLYFLSGVSNLTSCSACAASQTSRFVKPCTIDFPPVPEHGLPLFFDPTCCWLGSSEIYRLCVVPQVLEKVRDHCAVQVCAPFIEHSGSKEPSRTRACAEVPPHSLTHCARDSSRM